ncbi:SYTM protein, partial [Nycticryphes semicollaris]|nr:SYTM protein [Nycticryphes semicollaris]
LTPPPSPQVSGPDTGLSERLRFFQRLRAAQERRDGNGNGGDGAPPGTPILIALPGGSRLPGRAHQTTPFQVATQLGYEQAPAALVARVNGTLQDLDRPLECDTHLELLDFSTPEGRAAFWRSGACVLGAVATRFYGATFCSAQATEDGFFCDIHMGDRTVQRSELPALEEACVAFARTGHRFERLEATRQQLGELFKDNSFQLQQIEEEVTSPTATVYSNEPWWPRRPMASWGGVRKRVTSRWREVILPLCCALGRPQLENWDQFWAPQFQMDRELLGRGQQRSTKMLRDLEHLCAEEKLRDLRLFSLEKRRLRGSEYRARGFCEVVTPNIFSPQLWELSGHWQHYSTHMFSFTAGTETLSLKPMNCPAHCLMFAHRPRSWRELPLRLADFGVLHRNENPDTLTGLTRVRRFQQDDAHIFCTLEQLEGEIDACLDFVRTVYAVLGFSFRLALATRPPGFLGDPGTWDRAEQ